MTRQQSIRIALVLIAFYLGVAAAKIGVPAWVMMLPAAILASALAFPERKE